METLAEKFHWNIANSSTLATIQRVIQTDTKTLAWVSVGLLVYGILQLVEATGLWLLKRWGEYFAAVATALFMPLEVYEITEKVTWVRIGALVINIAAVVYLVYTKRLFGLRGGTAAYEAERHEAKLLEVEEAADEPRIGKVPSRATTAPPGT